MKSLIISVLALSLSTLGAGLAQAKEAKDTVQEAATAAAKVDSPKRTAQQEKMKTCNADAKAGGKKGAERKAFMKECLSSKKA